MTSMEPPRAGSVSQGTQTDIFNENDALPPWEQRDVAPIPYVKPESPPFAQVEQKSQQPFWATRENGSHERSLSSSSINAYSHNGQDYSHQSRYHTPLSTPPLSAPPAPPTIPYESVKIPYAPRSAPQVPSFVKGPPSPPDSAGLSRSSTTKSKSMTPQQSPALEQKATIIAMPGTMSARERSPPRSHDREHQDSTKKHRPDSLPLSKRLTIAFKDIFKRSPVDESDFERIEGRHWADEESPVDNLQVGRQLQTRS